MLTLAVNWDALSYVVGAVCLSIAFMVAGGDDEC